MDLVAFVPFARAAEARRNMRAFLTEADQKKAA
jgi:hypothetical protein